MNTETKGQFYRGRFAPSPSGPLHFGSLTSALASYLDAKVNNGEWLVRIEDIDPPREVAGSDKLILNSLETHGLLWDSEVLYQSTRHSAYEASLDELAKQDLIFYCTCTHRQLKEYREKNNAADSILANGVYPNICNAHKTLRENSAIRISVDEQIIMFADEVYGIQAQELPSDVGAFVLKRRDGLYSYQLAVVVDDIYQGITHIVRGVDLLDSTPRQLYLYQCLNAQTPSYTHLPLALLPNGKKLSKQTGAEALSDNMASKNLVDALKFLGQNPPLELMQEKVHTVINWAIQNWAISKITNQDIVI